MNPIEEFDVTARNLTDQPIPSYAQLYEEIRATEDDPERIVERLEARARAMDLPMPTGRGIDAVKLFHSLIDFLQGRHLVQDVGRLTVPVSWFALHIPPGGSAELKWKTSEQQEGTANLSLFGSGFGTGRTLSWAVEAGVPSRTTCMRFVQDVQVHVKLYEFTGKYPRTEPSVDVVAFQGRKLVSWPDCPYCGIHPDAIDKFKYLLANPTDLREYDTDFQETKTFELKGTHNMNVGFTVPALQDVQLGFEAKRTFNISCALTYKWASRRKYWPYKPIDDSLSLHYWALE